MVISFQWVGSSVDGFGGGQNQHRDGASGVSGISDFGSTLSASRSPSLQQSLITMLGHTETGAHPRRSKGATPQFALSQSGTGQPHGQLFPGIGSARPVVPPILRSR